MNMIGLHRKFDYFSLKLADNFRYQILKPLPHFARKHWPPEFRAPDKVIGDIVYGMACSFVHSKRIVHQFYSGVKPD